jgi:hypothetical protein
VSQRKRKKRHHVARTPLTLTGKSIAQWCTDLGVGRATFYAWKKQGVAPEVFQPAGPGGYALITPQAHARWREKHGEPGKHSEPATQSAQAE